MLSSQRCYKWKFHIRPALYSFGEIFAVGIGSNIVQRYGTVVVDGAQSAVVQFHGSISTHQSEVTGRKGSESVE